MTWTPYKEKRPEAAGLYEWRVPSKAIPGMFLIVAAEMRMRGAGYENVLSPEFDYWDGYSVHVQADVEWRPTSFVLGKWQNTPTVLAVEGLDLSPCSRCGNVPSLDAHHVHAGTVCNPKPWNLNSWSFKCCAWGKTPSMNDPRDIERIRRDTRGKAAPELLNALIELADVADRCDSWQSFPADPLEKARAAISKATGSAS